MTYKYNIKAISYRFAIIYLIIFIYSALLMLINTLILDHLPYQIGTITFIIIIFIAGPGAFLLPLLSWPDPVNHWTFIQSYLASSLLIAIIMGVQCSKTIKIIQYLIAAILWLASSIVAFWIISHLV